MHYEILVEGQSELTLLSTIMPQILGAYNAPHTWKIHKHRGIGKLPQDMAANPNPTNPSLLHNLPAKLRAYGRRTDDQLTVVVLVDLDDHSDCRAFKNDLLQILDFCPQRPRCLFRIAIEESEAWLLGDREALIAAYPDINLEILDTYVQDSQCGTWELLIRAVYGEGALRQHRSLGLMHKKTDVAKNVSRHMLVDKNCSASFHEFCNGLKKMQF
jgi:hypothetical protein